MYEVWCNTGSPATPNMCWDRIMYSTNGLITPYIKNTQVWSCPSQSNTGWGLEPAYGYNKHLSKQKEAVLSQPARIVLWADAVGIRWFPYSVSGGCCFGGQAQHHRIGTSIEINGKDGPHNEGANIAYADGHVKWSSIRSIPDEDDDAQAMWIRPR